MIKHVQNYITELSKGLKSSRSRLWSIILFYVFQIPKAVGWQQGHALGIRQPEHAGVWQDLLGLTMCFVIWFVGAFIDLKYLVGGSGWKWVGTDDRSTDGYFV